MTLKTLATGLAAAAAIAAIAAGTAPAAVSGVAVQPVVFGAPLPQAPGEDVPTPDQVVGVLSGIADPNVPAASKSGLVEGGLSGIECAVMDNRLRKGAASGKLPLTLSADNVVPAGPGAATADVTASSAKLDPRTVNLRFVNQDGWKLSHSSLMMLSQMTSN